MIEICLYHTCKHSLSSKMHSVDSHNKRRRGLKKCSLYSRFVIIDFTWLWVSNVTSTRDIMFVRCSPKFM